MKSKRNRPFGWVAITSFATLIVLAAGPKDFGERQEEILHAQLEKLFGFGQPLEAPAGADDVVARELASAAERQLLAKGLTAHFVARNVARSGDMIAFWPDDIDYTHLIVCIEQGRSGMTPGGGGGLNAGVQRVNVATGAVETILHGMSRCDGIRTTPWGTILATEETEDGAAYEIVDPLGTSGHWIADRGGPGLAADIRDGIDSPMASAKVVKQIALPIIAWEGLSVLRNGVVYGGDELRPGRDGPDTDGGGMFKFVPDVPYDCDGPIQGSQLGEGGVCSNTISALSDSPLASGGVYAIQVSCVGRGRPSFPQFGQGCEIGEAAWVQVDAASARADADALGASGYHRPEDLHRLRAPEEPNVSFCWTNTGNSDSSNFGEVMCATDENPLGDGIKDDGLEYLGDSSQSRGFAVVTLNRFVEGDSRFNSHDNLDIQPVTGNVYVIEDDTFGEVYACLPDGGDRDLKSDGCVSMLSVRDPVSEPTGFIFDGTGKVAFYIVQHGQQPGALLDFGSNPVDGTTDDLIVITGFRVKEPSGTPFGPLFPLAMPPG